jgi:hypothetical protein
MNCLSTYFREMTNKKKRQKQSHLLECNYYFSVLQHIATHLTNASRYEYSSWSQVLKQLASTPQNRSYHVGIDATIATVHKSSESPTIHRTSQTTNEKEMVASIRSEIIFEVSVF